MKTLEQKHSLFQRVLRHPLTTILISTLVIIIFLVITKELFTKPILNLVFSSEITIKTITALIGATVMILSYYLLLRYYEKKPFSEFSIKNALKELLIGLTIGFGAMGMVVLVLHLFGYYNFIRFKSIPEFLPTVAFILGAAVLEEIIFRGLFFRLLEGWKGPIIALIVSSLIFQIPHFTNSHTGILPAILGVLFGLVTASMYAHTSRLWLPIAFHFSWNLVQPICGTTLSGVSEFTPLSEARLSGPELLVGSKFGLEVSLFSFSALLIIGSYYFFKLEKRGYFKKNQTSISIN